MTNKEFMEAVVAMEGMNEEMVAFAQAWLEKDAKEKERLREKRAEKAAEVRAERAPMIEAVMACLGEQPKTAATLVVESGLDIKPAMIARLLADAVEDGTVRKEDVKVEKRKQIGYALV